MKFKMPSKFQTETTIAEPIVFDGSTPATKVLTLYPSFEEIRK